MNTPSTMSNNEKIRIAEQSLSRQLDWIKAVEAKVSVIVAITVAMLGFLVARIPTTATNWKLIALWLVIGGGPLIACLVFCLLASFPRVKSPNLSLMFFGSISNHSCEEYTKKFGSLTEKSYLDDLVMQVHRNAEIAAIKYGKIKWASGLLIAGVAPWLITLYALGGI